MTPTPPLSASADLAAAFGPQIAQMTDALRKDDPKRHTGKPSAAAAPTIAPGEDEAAKEAERFARSGLSAAPTASAAPWIKRTPPKLSLVLESFIDLNFVRDAAVTPYEKLERLYMRKYIEPETFLELTEQIPYQIDLNGRPTAYTVEKGMEVVNSIRIAAFHGALRFKATVGKIIGQGRTTIDSWIEMGKKADADPRIRAFSFVCLRELALVEQYFFDKTLNVDTTDAKTSARLAEGTNPHEASTAAIQKGTVINNNNLTFHKHVMDVLTGGKPIVEVYGDQEPDTSFDLLPPPTAPDEALTFVAPIKQAVPVDRA